MFIYYLQLTINNIDNYQLLYNSLYKLLYTILEVTPEVLKRLEVDGRVLEDMQAETWVGLAVLQVVGEAELVAEHFLEAL